MCSEFSVLHENLLWGLFNDCGDSYDALSLSLSLVIWEST